jgi:hypothetical protein
MLKEGAVCCGRGGLGEGCLDGTWVVRHLKALSLAFRDSLVLGQQGIAVVLAYSFARFPAWTVIIVHHLLPGALSQSLL